MNLKTLITITLVGASLIANAQTNTFPTTGSAGIGTTSPDAKAMLDIVSTSKGVLIPRMTKTQRDAIATPATGLLIYQTNSTPGFYFFNGTAWTAINNGANKTLSNLTAPTKLNQDLLPDTNNTIDIGSAAMRFKDVYQTTIKFPDATSQSTAFVPYTSGSGINISGNVISSTVATGSNLSLSNLAATAINQSLLPATTNVSDLGSSILGWRNIFAKGIINTDSVYKIKGKNVINADGFDNTYVGFNSGINNTTGYENTTNGSGTLNANTTGAVNTANGTAALNSNISGSYNTAYGATSLAFNTTGNFNTANGVEALLHNVAGDGNTANGIDALFNNTTGNSNTANGMYAGRINTIGSNNVFIGDSSNASSNNLNNATAIGSHALVGASNCMVLGSISGINFATASVNVGIGLIEPQFKLDVKGGSINTDSVYRINGTQVLSIKGSFNTFLGENAGLALTTGNSNTTVGNLALRFNTTGFDNSAVGRRALVLNTTGFNNTANGAFALSNNTTGSNNSAIGASALESNSTGNANTSLGNKTGRTNTIGNNNTFIGDSSDASGNFLNNATAIGSHALVGASNCIVMGSIAGVNDATASVNVGIGTSTPAKRFHVVDAGTSGGIPYSAAGLVLENNTSSYIQLLTPDASDNGILFGTATNSRSGGILYNAVGNKGFQFRTNGNSTKMVIDSSGQVGIGTNAPAFKLQVSTNSAAKPTSNTWTIASDARLKTNVHDYKEGLNELKSIHPVWFTYTGEAGMPKETGVGVLAQELKEVAPYMVGTWNYKDDNGKSTAYLSVDNGAMTYMLINAVNEQQKQIENKSAENAFQQKEIVELKNEISEMRSCLETICNSTLQSKTQSSQLVVQSYLQQNNPNPFSETTSIRYNLPQQTTSAVIKIYSMNGVEMKSYNLTQKGDAQIEVSGKTFSPGVYVYTLIVDGKTVDTKQMILTN